MSVYSSYAHERLERGEDSEGRDHADFLNLTGLRANREGDTHAALSSFLEARRRCRADPRFTLSAANMHLKLDEHLAALALYDELLSSRFTLTEAQAAMARSKRQAAHEALGAPQQEGGVKAQREAGVRATNKTFERYEQVAKPEYHLAAAADGSEAFDEEYELTTIDVGPLLREPVESEAFAAAAAQLGGALREIGFAILTGHGVQHGHYERCHEEVERLFTRLRPARKAAFVA